MALSTIETAYLNTNGIFMPLGSHPNQGWNPPPINERKVVISIALTNQRWASRALISPCFFHWISSSQWKCNMSIFYVHHPIKWVHELAVLGYPQNVIFFKVLQSLSLQNIVEEKEELKGSNTKMARWRWSIVLGILLTLGLLCKYAPILFFST